MLEAGGLCSAGIGGVSHFLDRRDIEAYLQGF